MDISTPESKQRCPKTQDILDLENAFFNFRDKAILWFIASAPFRLETIPKLLWKDLKPTNDKEVPSYLLIEAERLKGHGRGKYKGVKQVGFLHSLAVKKLEAYKKELERKGYYPTEDDSIFLSYRKEKKCSPFMFYSIEGQFGDASLRAWHDLEKKRFSPHDFRSFVQSALENAGVNPNMIAIILGHKPKGVDFHYSDHDIAELLEKFKTALPYLLPQSVERVKAESDRELTAQQQQISDLTEQLQKLQQTVERLYPKEIQRNVINDKGKIETWTETFTTPQEYIESQKKFIKRVLKHDQ